MPISEFERRKAEQSLRRYCENKTDPAIRHELEIVYRIEGNVAYLAERRPNWRDNRFFLESEVVKFRFVVGTREWNLYWRDRNLKWHRHQDCPPSVNISDLLTVVEKEAIFHG